MTSLNCFTTLPEELHILILSFLDHPHLLLTVSAVNVQLHRLVGDDTLWQALFLQYKHEKTLYEEQTSVSFKELFKQRFILDQNWNHSVAATNLHLQPITTGRAAPQGGHRSIQALVAIGGRNPVMAVACAKMPVLVYNLKTKKVMSVLPEEDTRTLALVLDLERERDEPEGRRRLTKGVSRGWGSRELRLVTGTQKIKVWTLPHRKGIVPLTMELGSRIRCMRAVDRTHQLLTGCIDGSVKLWDIEHGGLVRDLDGFHGNVLCLDVYQLRSSLGDGKEEVVFLAGGGSTDCTAKLWNLKTGETRILRGHQQSVHRILIDEDIVVSGALDSTVRTWRLDTGEPLGLFTSHKTIVSHISICTSPIRSLLSVCFDGVAAIHTLDEEVLKNPAIPRRPMRLNLASTCADAECSGTYFVVLGMDEVLSLFRLEPQNDAEGEAGLHIAIRPLRTISTGFSTIHEICVFKSGIIVGGFVRNVGPSFLYYDFAQEQTSQKT